MKKLNNLRQIREIYGATQEQIAEALSVNRVTVANWENGTSVASSTNREKLSIYYGIGPEFFYEKDIDETAKNMVLDTAERARTVIRESEGKRSKEEEFHKLFDSIDFSEIMQRYMFDMKILLAKAEDADFDKIKTALLINKKMGKRLEMIIQLREDEMASNEPSLSDLMDTSNNS